MFDFASDLANLAVPVAPKNKHDAANVLLFDPTMFPKRAPLTNPEDSLACGIVTHDHPPLDFVSMAEKCPFFRDAIVTGGKNNGQGLWNLSVLAATFCEKGEYIAHKISKAYPSYTREETHAMWDRKVAEREAKGLGWPSCQSFENEGSKFCAACVHKGKIKSPLNLAVPVAPSASNGADSAQPIVQKPAAWNAAHLQVSFSNIPHRHWLYGTYLIRGEITVAAAPGGAGKTALATGIAVEIATGIELLGEKIFGGDLKVLFINGEDGGTEIARRVLAFCLAHAHKIPVQSPHRLYVAGADDARVQRLSFLATTDRNFSILDRSGFEVLEAALEELRPDALILDPLVAFCGGGNMNDNSVMSQVIRELKRLATDFDCAVMIVHHTRKGVDDGNPEAISGASATVNLARRAIMPVTMTADEAKALGVLPSERTRYFKLVDAKSNLAPRSTDSPWYQLCSVELPNAEPPIYPFGDNVQAIRRVTLPLLNSAAATTDDQKIRDAILDLVNRGKTIDGQSYPYSPSLAGARNARALLDDATDAVAKATGPRRWPPGDLKAAVERAIAKMTEEGLLVEEQMPSKGRFRRGRALRANRSRIPRPDVASDESTPVEGPATLGKEDPPDATK